MVPSSKGIDNNIPQASAGIFFLVIFLTKQTVPKTQAVAVILAHRRVGIMA